MSKPIQSSQIKLRRLHVKIDGSAVTPVASGVDQYLIDSVSKLGAGNHVITLTSRAKARNANVLDVISIVPIGADASFHIVATTSSSVTILLSADVDFGIEIQANDNRFLQN